jgi:predicted unusual protein kinase regulating ubiquinone biosynthesis (AarF/ABC1/UbiB family)
MWAAIRLIRAMRVFGVIFVSYMWQLGLRKVFRKSKWTKRRWRKVHRRNARRMYKGFVRLRGVYIKLGQILSVMGTFLPRAYTEELEGLQDTVPPHRYRTIRKAFIKSIGKPPEEVFERFAHEPIAAASLGQVHEAITKDGERRAVKVLYPNVSTIIKVDLRVLGWALKVYRWFVPVQQIERVHEQLRDMLERETNFENEAACLERMSANFADDDDAVFPEVDHELSTDRVLTMTFVEGVKISRKKEIEAMGLSPDAVATKLVQIFYKQLFADRFFHADPHPGNFFVQKGPEGQPRIVLLDFGAASEITDNLSEGMLDVITGIMTRDDDTVLRGIETMGFVSQNGDRELLERTARKYFEKLLEIDITDLSKIDPKVAQDLADPELKKEELRRLMKSIEYPLGWFYVERAVVILFGLSAQLAPRLNTLQVGFPYIMKFLAEQQARKAAKKAAEATATSEASEETTGAAGDRAEGTAGAAAARAVNTPANEPESSAEL